MIHKTGVSDLDGKEFSYLNFMDDLSNLPTLSSPIVVMDSTGLNSVLVPSANFSAISAGLIDVVDI